MGKETVKDVIINVMHTNQFNKNKNSKLNPVPVPVKYLPMELGRNDYEEGFIKAPP